MRHYFKETKQSKSKLFKFAEEWGADYIEDDKAVWKKPTMSKDGCNIAMSKDGCNIAAVALNDSGNVYFGIIDEDCDNFIYGDISKSWVPETQTWFIKILKIIEKFEA